MIALGVHAVRPLDLACVLSSLVALLALFPQLLTIAGWSAATSLALMCTLYNLLFTSQCYQVQQNTAYQSKLCNLTREQVFLTLFHAVDLPSM